MSARKGMVRRCEAMHVYFDGSFPWSREAWRNSLSDSGLNANNSIMPTETGGLADDENRAAMRDIIEETMRHDWPAPDWYLESTI